MPVTFKYAMIEINGKPILVDKKGIADVAKALTDAVTKIQGLTPDVLKKTPDVLKNAFALQTPEGMKPVNLGSSDDFANWVSTKMSSTFGSAPTFSLTDSIGKLPEPFQTGLSALTHTDLVIYSAALFYTGDTGTTGPAAAQKNKLYGELVIGFQVPDGLMTDFPLALREIVIAVNNYPVPAAAAATVAPAKKAR